MAMTTNQTPGPTWYDILGVGREATPEQVKAAWRAATDKFEPGSGTSQFRLFNEAADVLLDPARRAAYDAELDAAPGVDLTKAQQPVPAAPVEAPVAEPDPDEVSVPEGRTDADADADASAPPPAALDAPSRPGGFLGRLAAIPVLVLAILGVV